MAIYPSETKQNNCGVAKIKAARNPGYDEQENIAHRVSTCESAGWKLVAPIADIEFRRRRNYEDGTSAACAFILSILLRTLGLPLFERM